MSERLRKLLLGALFRGMEGGAREWGSDIAAHMPLLALLARHSVGPIVECGVGNGFSTIALLSGAEYGVWSYDVKGACRESVLSNIGIRKSTEREELEKFWTFRVEPSVEAASDWADRSVGLFFLDTTHEIEETRRELAAWLPKIDRDGTICGHDYYLHEDPRWPLRVGVKHAVDEFAEAHRDRFHLQVMRPDQGFFILRPR